MHFPESKGQVVRQAHVGIPDGVYEEEYAREGFFGRYAHLYRSAPPVGWTHIEGPCRPRLYNLNHLATIGEDFLSARQSLFFNQDVRVQYLRLGREMNYCFRNADGDEIYFVHLGRGQLDTDFGWVNYTRGDYIVIPRGTVYRWLPQEPSEFLLMESQSEVRFPDRGMLGQHALFDPAVVRTPSLEGRRAHADGEYKLVIQRQRQMTTVTYPFYPINTVGWKGTLSVWQLNIQDIRPVISERYHLPPSAHTTFVATNFVVCTFLPRGLETGDPEAMKVPFYHSNIDYDEILFYHDGEFFSRAGLETGMLTFHPQGIHHGPQPEAVKRSEDATRTNEVAVMIDTRNPLQIVSSLEGCENQDYWQSWRGNYGRK